VPVIRVQDDQRELTLMRWGLIPHWAKDEKIGYRMINARAETVREKPSSRISQMRRPLADALDGFCYKDQRYSGGQASAGWRTRRVKRKNRSGSPSTAASSSSTAD
jgi:putative SOS response-associated peptidase YedK